MKKTLTISLVLGLAIIFSCKKKTDTVNPTGISTQTWTFRGMNFSTNECYADTVHSNLNLSANNAGHDSAGYCALICFFYGNTLPTANGTYTVALVNAVDSTIAATQVTFRLELGDSLNNYLSTGGNGHETVAVTVSNGKLSITGTGIEMAHYNSSYITDSAALNFNVTQTQ